METVGPQDSGIPDHPPSPAHLKLDKWASDKEMELSSKQALLRQTPRGQHSSSTSEVLLATVKIQGQRLEAQPQLGLRLNPSLPEGICFTTSLAITDFSDLLLA